MEIAGENLGRRFGRQHALANATFTCGPGEIIALIGNNGAGKTTLLQLLAGLLVPTSGRIVIDGQPLDRRDEALRRRIGIIPDFPPYFMDHTVIRHIAMLCALHRTPDVEAEQRATALMEEAGILNLGETRMGRLSRGETYKAVLVGMFLARPELWLLDEPMASGMDPQGLNFLRTRLREAASAGATVIYSTQIAEIAEQFSDRVFILHEGRLLEQEKASSLHARLGVATLGDALQKLLREDLS